MEWFRWFEGSTSDPKFLVVAKRAGQPVAFVLAVWAMLLERASSATPRGQISGFDCESADVLLGLPEGAACAIVEAMQVKGLVDGERVCKWDERQPKREDETNTQRVREFRERQRAAQSLRDETQCNAVKRDETLKSVVTRLKPKGKDT